MNTDNDSAPRSDECVQISNAETPEELLSQHLRAPVGQTGGVCERCGWPLYERFEDGCVEGSCSQRPVPPLRTPSAPVADAGRPGESLSALYADDYAHEFEQPDAGRQDADADTLERIAGISQNPYTKKELERIAARLRAGPPREPRAPLERVVMNGLSEDQPCVGCSRYTSHRVYLCIDCIREP